MAHVILFHSALGLRPGITHFAKQLESAGHTVKVVDLYAGETFEDYKLGNQKWFSIGIPALIKQAQEACKDLPDNVVFAGFSNGAALAEFLAATQKQAKGALLMHGALPPPMLQITSWPKNVPVQLHYNTNDPFRNPENDIALETSVREAGANFKEFLYEGATHLFADPDLPDYIEASAKKMLERALHFLQLL